MKELLKEIRRLSGITVREDWTWRDEQKEKLDKEAIMQKVELFENALKAAQKEMDELKALTKTAPTLVSNVVESKAVSLAKLLDEKAGLTATLRTLLG